MWWTAVPWDKIADRAHSGQTTGNVANQDASKKSEAPQSVSYEMPAREQERKWVINLFFILLAVLTATILLVLLIVKL